MHNTSLSFIPIGGIGDVTRNMYLYEYQDQILIVDCGLGFPDETMLGVDLTLPDIRYLQQTKKRIVGMVFTHGHEDHIGAVPYILPQLLTGERATKPFPLFGTPLTAAFVNEKLKEFKLPYKVQTVQFDKPAVRLSNFIVSFIRVTHSIPDTANLFIETPAGNFFHASDFKLDLLPTDGKQSDYARIAKVQEKGVLCLMSDCLGAEKAGYVDSEEKIKETFDQEMRTCKGKCIITTYSSNIARLNQAIQVAEKYKRHVCFIGRSLIKAKDVAQRLGYMRIKPGMEVTLDQVKNYPDERLLLLVAGNQGQENSAMTRIAVGEHREIELSPHDTVIFSSYPIPGNEVSVNAVIDEIAKQGARILYTDVSDTLHVSGHGHQQDLMLMASLTKPKYMLPIGGNFKHMVAYQTMAKRLGYQPKDVLLLEDGEEIIFSKAGYKRGRKIPLRGVYVDAFSGEEVENFVLRDRQKLSEGGIVIVLAEVEVGSGKLANTDIITRGFSITDNQKLIRKISTELKLSFNGKKGKVTNRIHIRKSIEEITEKAVFKLFKRQPLVLSVVVEV